MTASTYSAINFETEFESFATLIKAMQSDSVINKKVNNILILESYPRRLVLNNWLEQLRRNNAPQKLLQSLTCLFDDVVAEQVLALINKRVIYKKGKTNNL